MLLTQGPGNLLPLGIVMCGVLALPSIVTAKMGALMAKKAQPGSTAGQRNWENYPADSWLIPSFHCEPQCVTRPKPSLRRRDGPLCPSR